MSKQDASTAMNGASMNISQQRKQELKQLFPGAFTETRNDAGELVETIDFERLKAELGEFSELYDNRRERYGMDWPGKRDSLRLIQQPSYATLKPCRDESVDFDTTENLFIEGDNLEVLKLLQKSYYGQVKMIYIDPPYNTGKEFIYPDNFSESLDTYLQYAGLKDSEGRTFSTNTANEGRFHTKWLNMMFPRLYLARNLLREDGVIFISIDDNEVENLRRMCDEIFGEDNFIATIVWQKRTSPDSRANLSAGHDYLLAYGRNGELARSVMNKLPLKESRAAAYRNPDDDPRGPWSSENLTGQTGHATSSQFYEITTPSGEKYFPPEGRCWALAERTFLKLVEENRIWFGEHGRNRPRLKRFLAESDGMMAWTWWPNNEVGHNQEGTKEVKEALGAGDIFNNPKPTRLLKRLLQLAANEGDTVLDFFSGSGSFAQAVYEFNKEKLSALKFVLVQLPEVCLADSEAAKAGFRTISDIALVRLRKTAAKMRDEDSCKLNFGDGKQDFGFKVLKLDQSNFSPWRVLSKDVSDAELLQQLELAVDHVDPNASQEDLLYELLLKAGLKPTERIERVSLAGQALFSVADGSLLVYLDTQIDQALIDAVLALAPSQFICLDKAFHGNDQLKTNAVKTFAHFNDGKTGIERIDFKTV